MSSEKIEENVESATPAENAQAGDEAGTADGAATTVTDAAAPTEGAVVAEGVEGADGNIEIVIVPNDAVETIVEDETRVLDLGDEAANEMNEFENLFPASDDPLDIFQDFNAKLPSINEIIEEEEALAAGDGGPMIQEEEKKDEDAERIMAMDLGLGKEKKKEKQTDHDSQEENDSYGGTSIVMEDLPEDLDDMDDMEIFSDTKVSPKKKQKKKKTSWVPFKPLKSLSMDKLPTDDFKSQGGPAQRSGADKIIENLITTTTEICEYIDPDEALRTHLDKDKVVSQYIEKFNEYQFQIRKRSLLNRKLIDFYRRKKNTSVFNEDLPEKLIEKEKMFRETINELDKLRGREEKTRVDSQFKINELNAIKDDLTEQCNEQVGKLNLLLKETGLQTQSLKTGQYLSEKAVDSLIRKMSNMRKQISEVRYKVIQSLHRLAVLTEHAKSLEDLGNGLQMLDFEQLQADTTGLGEKIEERSVELERLRVRCNQDTNILAHTREKLQIDENKIYLLKNEIISFRVEQNYTRNCLHGLKLERDRVRKKINQISFECGLLDKPVLLIDFDNTQATLLISRNRVAALKKKKILQVDKLNMLETQLAKYSKRN